MNITTTTEVRTVTAVRITPASHFFFDGPGHVRRGHNDGQPDVLNARRSGVILSGRITGVVKMVHLTGALGWFSLRSVGPLGNGRTVYVKGGTLVVVDGTETTVAALYAEGASNQ